MSASTLGWPYASKVIVQHEFDLDHLNIWVTFRFGMSITLTPPLNLWTAIVDDVEKPIDASVWQDAWTLLLTVPDIGGLPARVLLDYAGPHPDLKIRWLKQWEPFGPLLSTELPITPGTKTFSTGPAQQDDVDIAGIRILFLDCSANAITIGAFVNGINGQQLFLARLCPSANAITLKHSAGTGNQNILLHRGADETLGGEYGGWVLVCNGTNWYDTSHAKHV